MQILDIVELDILKSFGNNEHLSWTKSKTPNLHVTLIDYFNNVPNLEHEDEILPFILSFVNNNHASNLSIHLVGEFDGVRQGVVATIKKHYSC